MRIIPLAVSILLACGDDGVGTTDSPGTSTSVGSSSGADSSAGASTTSSTSAATTDATAGTGSSSGGSSGSASSDGGSTTGIDVQGFERFLMTSAAGPCKPGNDCDGFIELLDTRMLRVEIFGDVSETVTEVEISEEDFAAAVLVFADPALLDLLDGPDPVCDPPTDIFESMTVQLEGVVHDAATTFCDQAPVAAARQTAIALREEYVP